jgi:signal transduction histidine kinase
MRAFIGRLRPDPQVGERSVTTHLADRLEALRRRITREWDVKLALRLHGVEQVPGSLVEDVYKLAQEGAINAARHSEASVIKMDLTVGRDELRLGIADDGRGFPFRGTYGLAELNVMDKGPLTLKERVAALGGNLTLRSQDSGTLLLITLPLSRVSR